MAVKDVTRLRKEGRLKEAYELARQELKEDPNEWTYMSMFWVLRDLVKDVYIPANDMKQVEWCMKSMEKLLPDMMDDSGAGEKAYLYLRKQILPNADIIRAASELSQSDPLTAYRNVIKWIESSGDGLDKTLHEDFGWIVYRYIKARFNDLQSVETRRLLKDYILLKNERPSMLHSTVLNFALSFSKGHQDFNFHKFFIMWGPENLRDNDYQNRTIDGKDIPSIVYRICRTIIESGEDFDIDEFVNCFVNHKQDVIEALRQAYFWNLMKFHKENMFQNLWKAFETYGNNYSMLGSSYWHSEILKIAYRFMVDENTWRFVDFMKLWYGDGNLRSEDWSKEKDKEGNEYPSVAVKSIKKCFDIIKNDSHRRKDTGLVTWLKSLYSAVEKQEPDDDWSIRNYATICLWQGLVDDAVALYKKLLVNKGDKYYLWSELATCVNDNKLRIGLLLKAKSQERNEDFLGDIHLVLASSWITEEYIVNASQELDAYAKHRKKKGWKLSDNYLMLLKQVGSTKDNALKPDYAKYIQLAEDFVFSDFDWHNYVLAEKWIHNGTEFCKFTDGNTLNFTVKTKRFNILRKAKVGEIFGIRCQIKEETKTIPNSNAWFKQTVTEKTIRPLTIKDTKLALWSLLPIKYGVVDYVNETKHVLHILTQESKMVFFAYNHLLNPGTFVKFREYEEKRNAEVKESIVNLVPCTREEAILNMPSRVVVVDDVNEQKQLFHIVFGKNLVSDIIRFEQTSIRPCIGDFLRITYCVKKNKEGKKQLKIFDIQPSDEECKGVTNSTEGRLKVGYKGNNVTRDEFGNVGSEPDYAFINDFYVHKNVLKACNIREDCNAIAKLVLGGDNKWKAYDIKIITD